MTIDEALEKAATRFPANTTMSDLTNAPVSVRGVIRVLEAFGLLNITDGGEQIMESAPPVEVEPIKPKAKQAKTHDKPSAV